MNKIVVGIIERNGKFLMVRRKFKEGELLWAFPGGAIEDNETEEKAIEREIFEEIDIKILALKKFGERVHPSTSKEICYWLCRYVSGNVKVKDMEDLDKVEWMVPSDIFASVTSDIFYPVKEYLNKL